MNRIFRYNKILFALLALLLIQFSCEEEEAPEPPTSASGGSNRIGLSFSVSDVSYRTANASLNFTNVSNQRVKETGVCWNEDGEPTVDDQTIVAGSQLRNQTLSLTGFVPNKTYYARSYIEFSSGVVAYSEEEDFTTLQGELGIISSATHAASSTTTATFQAVVAFGPGELPLTERGICWGTTANPTISDNKQTSGSGTGSFEVELTGLQTNSDYHARIYIINDRGTTYSENIPFSTLGLPTITSAAVTNVTINAASSGGEVTDDGNTAIISKGVVWDTNSDPTISLSTKTDEGAGAGSFTSQITGLSKNTTYYTRAYATNAVGTTYGDTREFSTPNIILPTLTTTAASSVTATSASLGGNITDAGNGTVSERGLVWNTTGSPTISDNKQSHSSGGTGSFSISLSGLSDNTTYFVRAYAINEAGTAYGDVRQFTTLRISLPTVTTSSISSIGQTTATGGGNVTDDGNASVTARGIVWSTNQNPTISLSTKTSNGTGTGSFSSSMTGLNRSTQYYVRAYATNSEGTAYGNQVSFTTDDPDRPTVTVSSTVTNLSSSTFTVTANITDTGGESPSSWGVLIRSNLTPTITSYSSFRSGSGTSMTAQFSGLSKATTYYIRAWATNSSGTSYSSTESITTHHVIGDSYQGGKIAYIYKSGDVGYDSQKEHGIIVPAVDQGLHHWWFSNTNYVSVATPNNIGQGQYNSNLIINAASNLPFCGTFCYNTAANFCNAQTIGGYSDWFLPSLGELVEIQESKSILGTYDNGYYWSSTQQSLENGLLVLFNATSTKGSNVYQTAKTEDAYIICTRDY